jgi:hypothetical protein
MMWRLIHSTPRVSANKDGSYYARGNTCAEWPLSHLGKSRLIRVAFILTKCAWSFCRARKPETSISISLETDQSLHKRRRFFSKIKRAAPFCGKKRGYILFEVDSLSGHISSFFFGILNVIRSSSIICDGKVYETKSRFHLTESGTHYLRS